MIWLKLNVKYRTFAYLQLNNFMHDKNKRAMLHSITGLHETVQLPECVAVLKHTCKNIQNPTTWQLQSDLAPLLHMFYGCVKSVSVLVYRRPSTVCQPITRQVRTFHGKQ